MVPDRSASGKVWRLTRNAPPRQRIRGTIAIVRLAGRPATELLSKDRCPVRVPLGV